MIKSRPALSYLISITLLIIGIAGLIYSDNLVQNNKETIFLTKAGAKSYQNFKEEFDEKSFVILKKDFPEQVGDEDLSLFLEKSEALQRFCFEECEILSPANLPTNFQDILELKNNHFLGLVIISDPGFIKNVLAKIETSPYWGKVAIDLHMVGVPFTNKLLNKYSKSIKKTLFPALFIGVLLILIILFRDFKIGLVLFFPCLLSASLTLSLTKYLYHESNLITSIIPLLMFVINLSLVLHVFYTALELRSIANAIREKSRPIILMVVTTFIGFFSLFFSQLQAISAFGILSASLIIITSFSTMLWLLSVDQFLKIKAHQGEGQMVFGNPLAYDLFRRFFSKKMILVISFLAILLGGFFYQRIEILTDATEYFPTKSKLKESIANVSAAILGPPIIDIIIDLKDDITIEKLKEIQKIEIHLLKELRAVEPNAKLISSNLLTQKANEIYTVESKLPDHLISYSTVRSKVARSLIDGFPLGRKYRINILAPPMNVSRYEVLINKTQEIFNSNDHHISFNGLYYHLMVAQKEMISTLFKSFLASLIIISLIALLAFKKISVFFIFLVVNIIPVFISFIFLKLFNISFNIATVMTYSISLGLIVDSSFHIIHTLDRDNLDYDYFYNTIIKPVISASLILAFCFSLFSLNSFLPIREFGICLSIIIIIGMIFDLKVLPSLYKKDSFFMREKMNRL